MTYVTSYIQVYTECQKNLKTFCFCSSFPVRSHHTWSTGNFEVPVLSEEVRKVIYDTELEKYTRLTWKLKYIFNSVSKFVSGPTRDKDAHRWIFPTLYY